MYPWRVYSGLAWLSQLSHNRLSIVTNTSMWCKKGPFSQVELWMVSDNTIVVMWYAYTYVVPAGLIVVSIWKKCHYSLFFTLLFCQCYFPANCYFCSIVAPSPFDNFTAINKHVRLMRQANQCSSKHDVMFCFTFVTSIAVRKVNMQAVSWKC